MMKVLEGLLGRMSHEHSARKPKSIARSGRANGASDYRAVEIAPSLICCAAAIQASGKRCLLNNAPRLPLMGCTMPTGCTCMYRKNPDRRGGDRRLLGTLQINRWFVGVESRKGDARRSAER
jgi:hypothetical protein